MPDPLASKARLLSWAVPAAAFAALALRQLRFVDRYAVNVLFFDQWGFYYPLFHGQSWWETFDRRHGPHREGIGLVVTRILADLSGWNSRWDAFAVSATLIATALLFLVLIRRCGNAAGFAAALAVPVLFFNAHQFEGFVGASNLSHGAMPILMLTLFCVACFQRTSGLRLGLLALLSFLLVFTGFGAFVGMIAPILFAVEAVQALRAGERLRALLAAAALASVAASWALFAHGYVFDSAQPGFRFPYEHPIQYPLFAARMLSSFFGWVSPGAGPIALGLALLAGLGAECARHGWRLLRTGIRENPRSTAIFVLAAFEVLYCASTAVGRVMGGDAAPLASRYVTLVIPVGMIIVLELAALRPRASFWSCIGFAAAIAPGCLILRQNEQGYIDWYHDTKATWKASYLETRDEKESNRRAHFDMYPAPLTFELSFLEKHGYNLFLDRKGP